MRYIGIDLGTSSVKMLLLNGAGNVEKIVQKKYGIYYPNNGWCEQKPEEWFEAVLDGLKEIFATTKAEDVKGIAIGGQMHGLVILDNEDKVIRPCILWNDVRTIEETKYLNETIGIDKLAKYTGNMAFAGFTAPKILWVKKNEPNNFERIAKVMLPKDYIVYKLTGVFSTDVSDASGMLLLDCENRCWSKEMCDIVGISIDKLPKVYESSDIVGNIKEDVANVIGSTTKTFVCAGAGDNAASAIGAGATSDGKCNISLGTSGTVFISTKDFAKIDNKAIHNFCNATNEYHLMGCILSAASSLKWFIEEILKTNDYKGELDKVSDSSFAEDEVIYLPYLNGERTPINDEKARGVFFNLSSSTKRGDMLQSVLEGVAFALRESIEIARNCGIIIDAATLVGGGAINEVWQKILANVLNIRLEILSNNEGGALGAAILAAVAGKEFSDFNEAFEKTNSIVKTIRPNESIAKKYDMKYHKYKDLYLALKRMF